MVSGLLVGLLDHPLLVLVHGLYDRLTDHLSHFVLGGRLPSFDQWAWLGLATAGGTAAEEDE